MLMETKNMNYNKFALKILALLIIAPYGILLPMENPLGGNIPFVNQPIDPHPAVEEPNLTPKERAEILVNAQKAIDSMQGVNIDTKKIIDDFNREQKERVDAADQDETNTIQWQNTILLGHPSSPVAIYNKDLVTASSLLVNLVAINALNNQLHECRINHILTSLTDNPDTWITLFEEAKEEKEKLDQEWLEKDILEKVLSKFKKSPYEKGQELKALIEKEHNFIGYNPFKQDLLVPLCTTFATQKITSFAEGKLLAKNACKEAAFYAFSKDEDGNLQQHANPILPLSATSVAKWWFFPGLATEWGDMVPDIKKGLPNISTDVYHEAFLTYLGVPKELYAILNSPITNFIIQIFSLGLGTKMMNNMYQSCWRIYIYEKQEQLIELLYAYKDVKSLPDKAPKKESVLSELKQFVIEGNTMSTLNELSRWSLFKDQAFSSISFYRSLPIWGIVAWKWRNEIAEQLNKLRNFNMNNNNNDNND